MRFLTAVALAAVIAIGCDPYVDQTETDVVIGAVTAALEGHRDNPYFPPDFGAHWLTVGGGPVILVFGHIDNLDTCQIIRRAMEEGGRPRRTDYECVRVEAYNVGG
jgi:hypothetical protein